MKYKLLIVQQDMLETVSTADLLVELGFVVQATVHNIAGLEFQISKNNPDLILVDAKLIKNKDQFNLISLIAAKHKLPIVYLLTFSLDSIIQQLINENSLDCILIPFNDRDVKQSIEKSLFKNSLALKAQEQKNNYFDLAESIPQIIFECDAKGRIIYLNKAGYKLLDLSKEEVNNGVYIHDLIPTESLPELSKEFLSKKIANKEHYIKEIPFVTKKGYKLFLDEYVTPIIKDNELIGVKGLLFNITEKKQKDCFNKISANVSLKGNKLNISINEFLEFVFDELTQHIPIDYIYFSEFILCKKELILFFGKGLNFFNSKNKLIRKNGRGLSEFVINNRFPLLLKGSESEKFHEDNNLILYGERVSCWVGIPIFINEECISLMCFQNMKNENAISDVEFSCLQSLGLQIGSIIDSIKSREKNAISQKNYRAIFDRSPIGILSVSEQGIIISANDYLLTLTGYKKEELIGEKMEILMENNLIRHKHHQWVESYFHKPNVRAMVGDEREISVLTKQGQVIPVEINLSYIKTESETIGLALIQNIAHKIEAKKTKQSLAEKETMLKEIHHRVKNNMQVISSLLNLQSNSIEDPEIVKKYEDSQSRIRTMALIHEKLYQSNDLNGIDFKDYLMDLVSYIYKSYQSTTKVQIKYDLKPLMVSLDQAIPCGLIINEFISNSMKYAFINQDTGIITVKCEQKDNYAEIYLSDNGVGINQNILDSKKLKSLGIKLIRSLSKQLRAKVEFMNGTSGIYLKLNFPILK